MSDNSSSDVDEQPANVESELDKEFKRAHDTVLDELRTALIPKAREWKLRELRAQGVEEATAIKQIEASMNDDENSSSTKILPDKDAALIKCKSKILFYNITPINCIFTES